MREIKFRAWDGKNIFYNVALAEGYEDWAEVSQCTDLKDKKGNDIYEGDVCEYNAGVTPSSRLIFRVVWDDSKARFAEHQALSIHDGSFLRSSEKVEVIGNIYENPDLLTV